MSGTTANPTQSMPLVVLGEAHASVCEGDFCEIPDHPEQKIVNRRLDDDRV